jgi:phage baseplate assembly protein W
MNDFIGAGWGFPLAVDPGGTIAMVGGHEKLEQSMRLILATYPGERPMRPRFGSTLRDYVFSGTDSQSFADIGRVVRESIEQWEPRVDVADVNVYPDGDQPGLLYIDILYTVPATNSSRNLVFPFYTIPEGEGEL